MRLIIALICLMTVCVVVVAAVDISSFPKCGDRPACEPNR